MRRRIGSTLALAALTVTMAAPVAAGGATAATPPAAPAPSAAQPVQLPVVRSSAAPPDRVDGAGAEAGTSATRLTPPNPGSEHCPAEGHAAVVDRDAQRGWLCAEGIADVAFPITSAWDQPRPGRYKVYAKDPLTTSTFGGHFSYLDDFVAFARGIHTGARVGFHAVPRTAAGVPYQPFDAVGTLEWRGDSSGCIRVLPEQAEVIWEFLAVGDEVIVIT